MGKKFSDIEYLLRIPVVLRHGRSFNLVNFGIFASAGSMTGYSICFFYLYSRDVPVDRFCWEMALVHNFFNLLFAKLFAVFSIGISEYVRNIRHYFNQTTFYHQGGLIGAIFGNIILCLFLRIPFTLLGDAMCLGGLVIICCLVAIHVPISGLIMVIFIAAVNLKRIVIQSFRLKSPRNKIPYKLVAFSIFTFTVLIMLLFHYLGESFFEKQYPAIQFTLYNYFHFLVSDLNIIALLIFVAVINFMAYGVHGRIVGTHTNLVA